MSAVFAAVGGAPLSPDALRDAAREMASRGADRIEVCAAGQAGIAGSRFTWEVESTTPGPILVDDGVRVVAADASIYYRDDLRRAIRAATTDRPFAPSGDTPGHLILDAYRAWGVDCARHLEGDYAFIVWDRASRTLTCARDFVGTRPLYYGRDGGRVVVASLASVVAQRTSHRGAIDVVGVGLTVANLFNVGDQTAYEGVSALLAGQTLTVGPDGAVSLRQHFEPPSEVDRPGSMEEGAEQLRALLTASIDQRLTENGTTTLCLSGGWDSSSILALATRLLRDRPANRKLVVVSTSYPVGDLGREDEAIQSISGHVGVPVSWVHSRDIRLFPADPMRAAAERDLPFAHAFENLSRTMAARARELGSHTVFTGTGGDELFAGTNLYLSDLLRRGRWIELALEWYRIRGRSLQHFQSRVIHPALAARASYGDLSRPGPFEQRIPDLVREDFVQRHRLREREHAGAPYGRYATLSSIEQLWSVTAPMFPRIRTTLTTEQFNAGVLPRTPFLDERLYRFAMSRPRRERVVSKETKRLLRRAMRGILPDDFLAPRPRRTGVTTQYMRQEMRAARPLFDAMFERPLLAELGIVEADRLRAEWQAYASTDRMELGLILYEMLQTEMWLRARLGVRAPEHAPVDRTPVTVP